MKGEKYEFIEETERDFKKHHAKTRSFWGKLKIFSIYETPYFKADETGRGGGCMKIYHSYGLGLMMKTL